MKKFFTRMLGVCSLLIAFSFTTTDLSAQCAAVPGPGVDAASACYAQVIANDPFCCNNSWDTLCNNAYTACVGASCAAIPPTCVDVSSSAYATTIANDAFCCNNSWDTVCQNAYNLLSSSCTSGCPDGQIADCNGNCAPAIWVGDSFCDDGSFSFNGVPIFFNCPEFGNDGGDCDGACASAATTPACVDQNGPAYAQVIASDAFCCNNTWDLVCQSAYDLLSSSCTSGCPEGQIADCNGNCAPANWVGDGLCDDGTFSFNGVPIFFNCPEFGNDGGDCDGTPSCTAIPSAGVDVNSACYAQVIATDPFCCNNTWDTVCDNAYAACVGTPGCVATPPSCVDANSSAYSTVIANDPFCCNNSWDSVCQGAYNDLNGSCLCTATPPACVNILSAAYAEVTANDPFCCNNQWDSVCQAAYDTLLPGNVCTLDCPDLFANIGDPCFTGGPFPGVVDANCACVSTGVCAPAPDCVDTNSAAYNTVITSDSFCCQNSWDTICQNAYDALSTSCTNPVDCPALGLNIGDACNDGNANTENDTVGADCVCAGTPINPCNVDGGTVATNDPRTGLCKGDGQQDLVQLTVSGNVGVGLFGIVRQSDLQVVASNTTGLFNIENLPAGQYFAGHVSVQNLSQLAGITNVNQLSGCFDLSNQLAVTSIQLAGGTVSTGGVTTVCGGNVTATVSGNVGPQSRFVLLNQTATIVIAQNTTGVFNFTPLVNGIYRIVHISFSNVNLGTITPPVLPRCVASSNLVTVTKVACPSAMLESSPNPTSGTSYVTFSVPTEEYTTLEVYDMSGRKVTELFRQVTEADAQYRLEFDGLGLPNGVYIYRLTTGAEVIIEKFMIAK
jgi:hypothetical protein